MPAVVNGEGLTAVAPSVEMSNGDGAEGNQDQGAGAGAIPSATKKPKLTKNQMKRMKKKEKKAGASRESRETSIVTQPESETEGVRRPILYAEKLRPLC